MENKERGCQVSLQTPMSQASLSRKQLQPGILQEASSQVQ